MLIALAVNPRAAFGRARHAGRDAAAHFRAAGADVLLLCEDSYAGLARAVDRALDSGVDALVVVGGDGMVHLGLNALAGAGALPGARVEAGVADGAGAGTHAGAGAGDGIGGHVPLGIIPTGTGNDTARALGLPRRNLPAACERVLESLAGGGRMIDAGRVTAGGTSRWFAGVVSAGFDAAVNERANAWRWPRGTIRYQLAMLRELASFRAINYTVTADGESWQQGAMLISVANGQSIGGGMRITPEAVLDDGLLDLFIVSRVSRTGLLAVFPKVFSGRHVDHPAVHLRRVRKVELTAGNVVAYADGERVGALPLTIEVVPRALRVLA
ncbi:diacylglycerol/lipid kinase family protein [Arthrobacter sp. H-02-3]|uniref:diacylglycerol/lipid kinase family protein n=1 Tax=Arthrobacter sp. H-02-3 TaxID=2703675 RepID=UPI000DD1B569|nr:diacylglycerol kinase family protein [Arthrobacter sp. H-02-3]PVZ56636.1 diacylglycerol kinase [Arthrobacter sp. H-02-3]